MLVIFAYGGEKSNKQYGYSYQQLRQIIGTFVSKESMQTSITALAVGIGAIGFLATIVVSLFLCPKAWTPRKEWLKRSVLSGVCVALGIVFLSLAVAFASIRSLDFRAFWQILLTTTVGAVVVGLLAIPAIYIRSVIWQQYERTMQQGIKKLKNKSQERR